MNSSINPTLDLSLFNNLLNKQIKQVNMKIKRKALNKRFKQQNKPKSKTNYICELIRPLVEQEKFSQEVSNPYEIGGHTLGQLLKDDFSFYFKTIEMQNQNNQLNFYCLPFQQNQISQLKIKFPFYLFLEQVSNLYVDQENQKKLFSQKQMETPQETIEFIIDHNQIVVGCNRIVNKYWLKMLGINSDMIIHHMQQTQTFPISWSSNALKDYNFYQDFISTKSLTIWLTNYNGQKFHAQIQIKYEQDTNLKKKVVERFIISYDINRKQLSLQQIEQNFANYFGMKQISKEIAGTFIEQINKQCGIKYI